MPIGAVEFQLKGKHLLTNNNSGGIRLLNLSVKSIKGAYNKLIWMRYCEQKIWAFHISRSNITQYWTWYEREKVIFSDSELVSFHKATACHGCPKSFGKKVPRYIESALYEVICWLNYASGCVIEVIIWPSLFVWFVFYTHIVTNVYGPRSNLLNNDITDTTSGNTKQTRYFDKWALRLYTCPFVNECQNAAFGSVGKMAAIWSRRQSVYTFQCVLRLNEAA